MKSHVVRCVDFKSLSFSTSNIHHISFQAPSNDLPTYAVQEREPLPGSNQSSIAPSVSSYARKIAPRGSSARDLLHVIFVSQAKHAAAMYENIWSKSAWIPFWTLQIIASAIYLALMVIALIFLKNASGDYYDGYSSSYEVDADDLETGA